jgi:hypothetical protein
MRPTRTGSAPDASSGFGTSRISTPGALLILRQMNHGARSH